jgi:hypothetical protein
MERGVTVSPKRTALIVAIAAFGVVASEAALARGYPRHGGPVRLGLYVSAPVYWGGYWGPRYYYPPYYYPPAVLTVPASPPTYVEQAPVAAPAAPAPQPGYWYYCAESRAYYPYVNQCPGEWQRVSPQPPSG